MIALMHLDVYLRDSSDEGDDKTEGTPSSEGSQDGGALVRRERALLVPRSCTFTFYPQFWDGLMDAQELSDEEFARRGNEIFEERVRPNVDADVEAHEFVAIDVESSKYEIDESDVEATDRLVERDPGAEGRIWLRRVGSPHAYRFGTRFHSTDPAAQ